MDRQIDYKQRINRVFDYIDAHLDSELSLHTISKIAFFSPFHFHRIFKMITGETLNEYVTRRRIEKSAALLLHKRNMSITALSLQNGFTTNSSFTRAFKKFYGVSPTEFRKQNPNKFSKIRQLKSKNGKAYLEDEKYICVINHLKNWTAMHAEINIKSMPKMHLAYVSSIGPQHLETAYKKLMQWATPKGLLDVDGVKMLTIYHDSFKVTAANKVRMSACITLNKHVETDGEIGRTAIDEGTCIIGRFEIGQDDFEKSWTGLFIWMNENGYEKADRNPFEIYHNNFNEHPEKKCVVDLCIPIVYKK